MKTTDERKTEMGKKRDVYEPPAITSGGNIKDVTFECPNWQCSVTVPPPLEQ